jgi:hypothetical protein
MSGTSNLNGVGFAGPANVFKQVGRARSGYCRESRSVYEHRSAYLGLTRYLERGGIRGHQPRLGATALDP